MADGGVAAKSPRGRMQPRILQSAGRRYSLRRESCYWDALTNIAARRGVRLNRLVAEIAGRADGGSLASCLRAFCLAESERTALRLNTPIEHTSVVTLVETAPTPVLAVDTAGRIVVASAPLLEWVGVASEVLVGAPLLRHFRFHGRAGLHVETLWRELDHAAATIERVRMIHIAAGRVLTANVRFVPIRPLRGRSLCLIWIAK